MVEGPAAKLKTSAESLGPNRTGFFDRDEVVAAAVTGGRGLVIPPLGTAAATTSFVYL